ncbi:hypothetical protein E3N88_17444 [Mikania micrantha]|uniref:Anaphase-promoting complex subunit 4 WD40 domain-containing protein n=1 Tax=Mikania micrantha TaxID=192012 RepID=A0A5N6NUM7_9ASTR|nr:hypothetical protein E3N88_17411 [Mikania micrantha]KAD5317498.1 hypothetical protein E3N88_17444 [Mikania micrantha]
MDGRRTMSMNWDGIEDLDDDDDVFFDASSSSDEEFEDSQMSFSSAGDYSISQFHSGEYDMWITTPESIIDRRQRLLRDMGLGGDKELLGFGGSGGAPAKELSPVCSSSDGLLLRSRSDGSINTSVMDMKRRKEEIIGSASKQSLTRTSSGFSKQFIGLSAQKMICKANDNIHNDTKITAGREETILLIKNADNGKKGMVTEMNKEGECNKLSDVQTGNEITPEEFEKNVRKSPEAKAVDDRKLKRGNSSFQKSFNKSKKKGAALFKNIKLGSIGGSKTDKERASTITGSRSINGNNEQKPSSQWVKTRVRGKTFKEFTALHRSQEIHGHDGSIWTMKFTLDGHHLATAGEDKVIRVWEVQEFDVTTMRSGDDSGSAGGTPVHPMAMMADPDGRPPLPDSMPEKKKGKKKKGIPGYVHVPETVFGLSETPFCTLNGHLDDVLDLSWSRSRLLLSSSMDKTVRLWDIETKDCLKLFSHTDYVTCIQFNPADDDYFISGSLDAKVRIWNITDRHVTDWIDLHEMVTAVGYSNDGKVSVVGSHKGICRFYNTSDYKLEFKDQVELKSKKKPQPRKITGFQFSTGNPSEVLVTSADSRVRILDGTNLIQKYKGYKNNNSQFLADYSTDGKYIISASEDSQVYVWRHDETKAKHKHPLITSYEHFPCKEVSVTAPWPGSSKLEQPLVEMHSKKHSKKSTITLPPPLAGFSPTHNDVGHSKRSSSPLPPLPKRNNPSIDSNEDIDHHAHADSSLGPSESFSSAIGSSSRVADVSSPSPSSMSSPGWGGNHSHKTIQATAWGLVIVTGGLGGEITVFQNMGLPFKVGRL